MGASTGPVPDDQLKVVEGEDIDWSVVSFDVAALADDLPEGGPLAVDRDSQDLASAISRDDACRVVAEAFVLEPATKKRFVVSNGGEMSALYLRSLREQGFSRRAELGKLIQGDMAAFEEAQQPKEEVVEEKTEEEKKAEASTAPRSTRSSSPSRASRLPNKEKGPSPPKLASGSRAAGRRRNIRPLPELTS